MNIFRKKDIDPNIEVEMLLSDYAPLSDSMEEYDDIYFGRHSFAKKIFASQAGIVVLIPTMETGEKLDKQEAERLFKSYKNMREFFEIPHFVYPVVISENGGCFWGLAENTPVFVESTEDFLIGLCDAITYENCTCEELSGNADYLCSKEIRDEQYSTWSRANISDDILVKICERLENMVGQERPSETTMIDENGDEWVLRDKRVQIGIPHTKFLFDTGLIGKKAWFRVSHIETEREIAYAVFGGCFGLHHLYVGNIFQGVLYVLTCGFAGLLPAIDVLLLIFGNFGYKVSTYFDTDDGYQVKTNEMLFFKKLKNPLRYLPAVAIAFVIGYLLNKFVYSPLLIQLCKLTGMMDVDSVSNIVNLIPRALI